MIKAKDLEKMSDEQRANLNLVSKSKYCQYIEKTIQEGGFPTFHEETMYVYGMLDFASRFGLLTDEEDRYCCNKLTEAAQRR